MKKKGIKKYQIGAEGLLGGSFKSAFSGGGSGMVNPGNANLMKMAPAQTAGMPISTPSTANPNAKSLTDIKLPAASSIPSAAKGPSFGDKAGAFMGNYGGAITSAASSLMPLLMKKPDPNAKPYKTGTKNLNSNMKKKYDDGVEGISNNPRFQQMMAGDTRKTSTGLTPSPAYGTTTSKPAVRQKPAMSAEMSKVARLQQKMKAAGYDIKVDGAWGKETQKIYDAYNKDKSADASRRGTVNTGQGPVATQPKTNTQSKSNTYNPLDSPVLRGAANDTQVRMKKDQAIVDSRARARQAEIARNEQSLPSNTSSNRFTFNASDRGQGQDMTTAQNEALKRNKLVGDGSTSKNSTRIQFVEGTKKVSAYSKLDSKLGGFLPGGVTRAEAKAAKAARKAIPTTNVGPMASGYKEAPKATTGVGPLAGGLSTPAPDLSKPVGPMTDIKRYMKPDNSLPAYTPTKKSLKSQYEENKGGYSRALKSGKKDAQGNVIDPDTGLAYKKLASQGNKGGNKGDAKKAVGQTTNFNSSGMANKNVSIKGINYFTNGRAVDQKTGKKGNYDARKGTIVWDKAAAAKKRKGDDTFMDEGIDIASRAVGSIGGGALGGFLTGGIGTAPGAIAGDYAGKRLGNYINKKLGYREENDTSQEGYSAMEGIGAAVGGGLLSKAVKPVGGAIMKYASKEASKVAAAPLGRAISFVGKSKAGQAVSNVAGKAKNLVSKGGNKAATNTQAAASQTTSKVASKAANPSVATNGIRPTAQSSRAVGKVGPVPTKAVKGARGRFTKNPANTPIKVNSTVNPKQLLTKRGATSSITAKPTATAQGSVQGPAEANLRQNIANKARTASRKTKETGRKAINFVKNNKKKTAVGVVGGAGLVGGGYALSKTRTGE